MKKGFALKVLVYFLSVSFLLMMNGMTGMFAEAKERVLPVGEMVSNGEVKFEARENVWKEVEASHFPIFQGTRVKTDKGIAVVTHSNNSQIEISPNSLFSFDQNDRFVLSQGGVEFRIPSGSEINFKVGNLSVLISRTLQATKGLSLVPSIGEETAGAIFVHANGSVTVKSLKGKLTLTNQDRVVLAALSSKDSVTIPSMTVVGKPPVRVAQTGPDMVVGGESGPAPAGGMSTKTWVMLIGGGLLLGGAIVGISAASKGKDHEPSCP